MDLGAEVTTEQYRPVYLQYKLYSTSPSIQYKPRCVCIDICMYVGRSGMVCIHVYMYMYVLYIHVYILYVYVSIEI